MSDRVCQHLVTQWSATTGNVVCLNCGVLIADSRCHKKCPKCEGHSVWIGENRAQCDVCDIVFSVVVNVACELCKKTDRIVGSYTVVLKDSEDTTYHCHRCNKTFVHHKPKAKPPLVLGPPPPSSLAPRPYAPRPGQVREYIICPLCHGQVPLYYNCESGYCRDCEVRVTRGANGVVTASSYRTSRGQGQTSSRWYPKGVCRKCGSDVTVYTGSTGWCPRCQATVLPKVRSTPYLLEVDL